MPNAGQKKNKPITKSFGFHLKVANPQFKPELPISRNNPKWFLAPGLFESPYQANNYADRNYGVGSKRHIQGARVNIAMDPEVLAEIKAAQRDQQGGKRILLKQAPKESAPAGGFKKNPTPMKRKVVEVIKKVTKRVATKANPS